MTHFQEENEFKQEANYFGQIIHQAKKNGNRKSERISIKNIIKLYKHLIVNKVNGPIQNDNKLLLSKIQKILEKEINNDCNKFEDLNINLWYNILISTKTNKWSNEVDKMDLKKVMKKMKEESIEGKFNIFIWRWWGVIWDGSGQNLITRKDKYNKKIRANFAHSRLCIAIKLSKFVIWFGYDPSGFKPGGEAFFKSFIKKPDNNKRIKKDLRLRTLHDNLSYIPMVQNKYNNFFNASYKRKIEDKKEKQKYCCDEAVIICAWVVIIKCIEKWTELQTIQQRFYEIKKKYGEQTFYQKKKLLNKEIKIPIRNVMIEACQEMTDGIIKEFLFKAPHEYGEILSEVERNYYNINNNNNNKNKNKKKNEKKRKRKDGTNKDGKNKKRQRR